MSGNSYTVEIRHRALTLDGNMVYSARGRGDWRDTATNLYNKKIKRSRARRHLALCEEVASGLYIVQFGHYLLGANSVSLDDEYIVSIFKGW